MNCIGCRKRNIKYEDLQLVFRDLEEEDFIRTLLRSIRDENVHFGRIIQIKRKFGKLLLTNSKCIMDINGRGCFEFGKN